MPDSSVALLDAAWLLVIVLKFSGLAAALTGTAIFGWHFVSGNARAAQSGSGEIPASSWRGPGALLGIAITLLGFVLTAFAIILASMLPGR